jgi:predicted Zn-dependent protease
MPSNRHKCVFRALCLTVCFTNEHTCPFGQYPHSGGSRYVGLVRVIQLLFLYTECIHMNRFSARFWLLVFPSIFAAQAWAQTPAAHVEETARKEAAAAPPIAPIVHRQQLFGTLPVATRSDDARKLLETALDQYENGLLDMSVATAHKAAVKDSHFALAYAVWSYAAHRGQPSVPALQHAKTLAAHGTPEEQLLANWMIDVQQGEILPAIGAMNDLLSRMPNDKHVLYLTSEWLYLQGDYDRARKMFEKILQIDPNFPPALNMLGYAYIETGNPDPAKAISYLKRYAALQPNQPNPEDSLGEVLRFAGDDQGSLEHYAAALKIITNFVSSQLGIADTRTLMGDYTRARAEYDKVLPMATNSRDRLHAQYQKALVYFWEGQPEQGRKELEALQAEARKQKDSYEEYEIGYARALLSGDTSAELNQLRVLETLLQNPVTAMSEPDRIFSLASVRREQARAAALGGFPEAAQEAISKLQLSESNYESAQGYLSFAKGAFPDAVDELSSDPHSVLAVRQLAVAQEQLGDTAAAEATRTQLKYLRAPTVEWFLVTHAAPNATN